MTPERYRRIGELFDGVLERPAAERAAWLAAACAGDEALRQDVQALVDAEPTTGDEFLERPAIEDAAALLARNQRPFQHGDAWGPFVIDRLLGAGGMGQVYLALDTRSGEPVALKLMPPALLFDASRARRFRNEAKVVSSLEHPNIVAVRDTGEVAGTPYIATEYVDGETLRERLARVPLAAAELPGLTRGIVDAVAAAHRGGVVHRDLKPENIMLRCDGQPKVLDFGLARLVESDAAPAASATSLTRTGAVLGTARYMSPEQARGEPVDARADVFSLGALLYELWSGQPPFTGPHVLDVLDGVMHRDPAPLPPSVPKPVARAIQRALSKDVAARPADAAALGLELEARDWTWLRWAAACAALVLVGAFGWWWTARPTADFGERDGLRVLPFRAADERLGRALALVAETELAQSPQLQVVTKGGNVLLQGSLDGLSVRFEAQGPDRVWARASATAASREQLPGAVAEACRALRRDLGESRESLGRFRQPPELALGRSLEAIEAFASGDARRAVELDPNFAVAWRELNLERAYELRNRTTEREGFRLAHAYHVNVSGDLKEAAANAEQWRAMYPRDTEARVAAEHSRRASAAEPEGEWEKRLMAATLGDACPMPLIEAGFAAERTRWEQARAAFHLARCGQPERAEQAMVELRRRYPRDTRIHELWSPRLDAAIAAARRR